MSTSPTFEELVAAWIGPQVAHRTTFWQLARVCLVELLTNPEPARGLGAKLVGRTCCQAATRRAVRCRYVKLPFEIVVRSESVFVMPVRMTSPSNIGFYTAFALRRSIGPECGLFFQRHEGVDNAPEEHEDAEARRPRIGPGPEDESVDVPVVQASSKLSPQVEPAAQHATSTPPLLFHSPLGANFHDDT